MAQPHSAPGAGIGQHLQPVVYSQRLALLVSWPLDTWETDESRDAGYLAAAFDGEGWVSRATGAVSACHAIGFSQRDN